MEKAKAGTSKAILEVEVDAKLEKMAAESPPKLIWKDPVAELLKLLDLDRRGAACKEPAEELGCPPDPMNNSARRNVWHH